MASGCKAPATGSGAVGTLFSALEAIFKPVRKVKRHLREGNLVKYGRDAQGRRRHDIRRRPRRALPDDVEAGSAAKRIVGEEVVHLMGAYEEVPDVEQQEQQEEAEDADEEEAEREALARNAKTPEEIEVLLNDVLMNAHKEVDKLHPYSDRWEQKLLALKAEVERLANQKRQKEVEQEKKNKTKKTKEEKQKEKSVEAYVEDFVKECLLHSVSEFDLVQRAELLIDADWMMTVDEIPGSMYRMAAFGEFDRALQAPGKRISTASTSAASSPVTGDDSARALSSSSASSTGTVLPSFTGSKTAARVRLAGFVAVLVIQICGPPLIFGSVMPKGIAMGVEYDGDAAQVYEWSNLSEGYMDALKEEWSNIHMTKIMGILFLCAFLLNACYVVYEDYKAFNKIYDIFGYLNRSTPNFDLKGNTFLLIGTVVNCWVVGWCSIDAFFVIGSAMTPKDLLLDALGLIFLYNLDDVGGDFGFVDDDDWPGPQLGWIHAEMVSGDEPYQLMNEEERESAAKMEKEKDRKMHVFGQWTYVITIMVVGCMLFILPLVSAFLPFHAVVP